MQIERLSDVAAGLRGGVIYGGWLSWVDGLGEVALYGGMGE